MVRMDVSEYIYVLVKGVELAFAEIVDYDVCEIDLSHI